jgi:opacity protein-like surface antigen
MTLGGQIGYDTFGDPWQTHCSPPSPGSAATPNWSGNRRSYPGCKTGSPAKEAYYSATSKSGIGYTLRAGADYKVNKQMTLGANPLLTAVSRVCCHSELVGK